MKLTIPNDYSLKKTGVSQSLLNSFMSCPKRFLYSANRWHKKGVTLAMDFGSMVHEVLDKSYHFGKVPDGNLIYGWLDDFDYEGKADMDGMLAYVLMTEYVKYYESDFTGKKFKDIEKVFKVRIGNYTLRGKIDGIYRDKQGKLWLMEHKTKSRIVEDNLMLRLSFDFQNLFYVMAAELMYKTPVTGVLYNIIRKPGHKVKKGESLTDFGDRIRQEIGKDPGHFFLRYEIPYTKKDKAFFKKELEYKLDILSDMICDSKFFYHNQASCDNGFACQFFLTKLRLFCQNNFLQNL